MRKIIPLIGRILISQIFLASGFEKIMNFEGTQKYMVSFGMPFTAFFAICAIVLEIGGGLSVLLGYKARIGAVLLVVFLIPTTLIFHTNFADQMQVIQFMKNLAILGGLFVVAGFGAGSFSFDKN